MSDIKMSDHFSMMPVSHNIDIITLVDDGGEVYPTLYKPEATYLAINSYGANQAKIAEQEARIKELEEMLKRFLPANDYWSEKEEAEYNLGGGFLYNEDSESMGLEVKDLLSKHQ